MGMSESSALAGPSVEQHRQPAAPQSQALEPRRAHLHRADAHVARAGRVQAGAEATQRRATPPVSRDPACPVATGGGVLATGWWLDNPPP